MVAVECEECGHTGRGLRAEVGLICCARAGRKGWAVVGSYKRWRDSRSRCLEGFTLRLMR
jgi:hypothetical protein